MKRFVAFALCALLLVCAFTIVGFAEEQMPEAVEPMPEVEQETALPEAESQLPEVEQETPAEPSMTETIVNWVKENIEEISVIVTLLLTIVYNVRKHALMNRSIGALNNNAIAVAEHSTESIQNALTEVSRVNASVVGYSVKIEEFLAEFRANAEEKKRLEELLSKTEGFLETAKLANVELANEVAELLVLANIPNSKKDELYARHLKAVNAIDEAEHTEVIHHDGDEA